jgi:hypothetical protein
MALVSNINQGFVRNTNTNVQSSVLAGGVLANTFDFTVLKPIKGYAKLGAVGTTGCQVYANWMTNPASNPNTTPFIPAGGLNAPAPLRLNQGDIVVGYGLLSQNGALTTTNFFPSTAGNVSGTTSLVVTGLPGLTTTTPSAANVNGGCFVLNAALPVVVPTAPAQVPAASPSVNVAPYVILSSGAVASGDAGAIVNVTLLVVNLGMTQQ